MLRFLGFNRLFKVYVKLWHEFRVYIFYGLSLSNGINLLFFFFCCNLTWMKVERRIACLEYKSRRANIFFLLQAKSKKRERIVFIIPEFYSSSSSIFV